MASEDEERAKIDEKEVLFYGFCSSQLYIDYRDKIDQRLKFLMVELTKYYKDTSMSEEEVDQMLLEQYKTFWATAEPSLRKFYEETQNTLALPPNYVPEDMSPKKVFCDQQIKKLETEINTLQEQFEKETWFLQELKHKQAAVNTTCLPLIDKLQAGQKTKSADLKRSKAYENFNKSQKKSVDKFLTNFDQNAFAKFTASDVECNDEGQMLDFYEHDLN